MGKGETLSFRRVENGVFGPHEVGEPTFANGREEPYSLLAAARLAIAHLTGEDLAMTTGDVIAALQTAVEAHGR